MPLVGTYQVTELLVDEATQRGVVAKPVDEALDRQLVGVDDGPLVAQQGREVETCPRLREAVARIAERVGVRPDRDEC